MKSFFKIFIAFALLVNESFAANVQTDGPGTTMVFPTPAKFRTAAQVNKTFSTGGALLSGTADYIGQYLIALDGAIAFATSTGAGGTHGDFSILNNRVYFFNRATVTGILDSGQIIAIGGATHYLETSDAAAADNVAIVRNLHDSSYSAIAFARPTDSDPGVAAIGMGNHTSTLAYRDRFNIATNPPSNDINGTCPPITFSHERNDVGGFTSHLRLFIDPANDAVSCYGVTLATVQGPTAWHVDAAGTLAVGTSTHTASTMLTVNGNISNGTGGATSTGTIELGHANDTTFSRVSAGVAAIEGSNIITASTAKGYALCGGCLTFNPSDATPYFWGNGGASAPQSTTEGNNKFYIPKGGTVKVIEIWWRTAGVSSSNEAIPMTFRLNGTTDTAIATVSDTNAIKRFSNTGLSIAVVQGDYFELKMVAPTWVTNPTGVTLGYTIYIE